MKTCLGKKYKSWFGGLLALAYAGISLTGVLAPAHAADSPDLSVAGITLGMSLEQVKAALPKGSVVVVQDHSLTIEGVGISYQFVRAEKKTNSGIPDHPDCEDIDTYAVNVINGKGSYIVHYVEFGREIKNDRVYHYTKPHHPLEKTLVDGIKAKYGLTYTLKDLGHWHEGSGRKVFIYRDGPVSDTLYIPLGKKDNNFGYLDLNFIDIPMIIEDLRNDAKPGATPSEYDNIEIDLKSDYYADVNYKLQEYHLALFDTTEFRKISTALDQARKQRMQSEDERAKRETLPL